MDSNATVSHGRAILNTYLGTGWITLSIHQSFCISHRSFLLDLLNHVRPWQLQWSKTSRALIAHFLHVIKAKAGIPKSPKEGIVGLVACIEDRQTRSPGRLFSKAPADHPGNLGTCFRRTASLVAWHVNANKSTPPGVAGGLHLTHKPLPGAGCWVFNPGIWQGVRYVIVQLGLLLFSVIATWCERTQMGPATRPSWGVGAETCF